LLKKLEILEERGFQEDQDLIKCKENHSNWLKSLHECYVWSSLEIALGIIPNRSTNGLLVSFASEQIKLGVKYDQKGKHLKLSRKGKSRHGGILVLLILRKKITI
jgi:hypothetical protein